MSFLPIPDEKDRIKLRCDWTCFMVRLESTRKSPADSRVYVDRKCKRHITMLQKMLGKETWDKVMEFDREQYK